MDNFFLLFFIPTLMIVFGLLSWKFTPKKNKWFGYRTKRSLSNTEAWEYANKTCGFYWFFAGAIELIVSSTLVFVFCKIDVFNTLKIINFILDISLMLSVIPYTEIKLKKKF